MSLQVVAVLMAVAVLIGYAVSRVLRVRAGLESRPVGSRLALLLAAVVLGPSFALMVIGGGAGGQSAVFGAVMLYFLSLGVGVMIMGLSAVLVRSVAPVSMRPVLLLALIGREASLADVPVDPPITPELSESVARVTTSNDVFPRGRAFLDQSERPGFQEAWNSLDAATTGLETRIAASLAAGTGVSQVATDVARDARSRLDTLRRAASFGGQAWAA